MLTQLETEVLSRVAEDYEAAQTIAPDIARDWKHPVLEAEVLGALLNLARAGLVQAYVYESSEGRYRPISAEEAEGTKEPWFMSKVRHQFDVTRERIRQIEERALKKLRDEDD